MKYVYQLISVIALFFAFMVSVNADKVDRDWENRVSERLAEKVDGSEVLWLNSGSDEFLALYTPQTNEVAHGAAIILHAMGGHAEWPRTVSPLRTQLPLHGWTTLSVQMPVIAPENQLEDYGATLQQAADRIEAAVKALRERKFLNIVVVAHSFGAATTLAYLEKQQKQKVVALVAIGLHDYAFVKPPLDILKLIEKSKIPVLDIYGSRDFKKVIDQAPDRRLAAKKGNNRQYAQYEIEGADHYFNKSEEVLIKRIRGWLDKAAPGVSIMVDEEFDGNLEDIDDVAADENDPVER